MSELFDFPTDVIVSGLVKSLKNFGLENCAVVVIIGNVDNGDVSSAGNLDADKELDMIRWVVEQRENGNYDRAIIEPESLN